MKRHLEANANDREHVEKRHHEPENDEAHLELFKKWLNDHHVIWNDVDIRSSVLYKGFALYSTSSEKPLANIEIPVSLLMSTRSANDSLTFTHPTDDIFEQTDQHIDRETLVLTLFLLHERSKGSESLWYPYIQLLPHTFSTPLFHQENYLENSPVFHLAQTMRDSMSEVCRLLASDTFSLKDFLWAYTVIDSRAFKLTETGTTLIPLADLANHVSFSPDANLRSMGIDKTTERFVLTANKNGLFDKDEELCLKYNELANWQLLLYYGFTIRNNPFDSITLELHMETSDTYEMEMKKMLLLELSEEMSLEYELQVSDSEPIIGAELLASVRLIVMSNEELDGYTVSNVSDLLASMVNIDNERRVFDKLLALLDDLTQVYFTTSLEDNVERLKSDSISDEERYSLIYLIGQKQILHNARQWINTALTQIK